MLTGLGIEIRSFALVKTKNSLRFWGSLDAASMNLRERSYSGLDSSFPVAACVLSSLDLNPPRDEAVVFLWDDWTRAWSILHLGSFSRGSDAYMSPAIGSQQCLSFLTLFINLCTLRYPMLFRIHHIVVGCPSGKPLVVPLTAISLLWSFHFLLAVSYTAGSVCLSNDDLLQ